MTQKGRLNTSQIGEKQVRNRNVGQNTIAEENILDGAVTNSKINDKSVNESKLSDNIIERLLPESTDERRYSDAIASAIGNPSETNPFVTKDELRINQYQWLSAFEFDRAFAKDPSYTVRLRKTDGVVFYKDSNGNIESISIPHSKTLDKNSDDEFLHIDKEQKDLIEQLVSINFNPITEITKEPSPNASVSRKIKNVSKTFANIPEGSVIIYRHDEIIDDKNERQIEILISGDVSTIPDESIKNFGHGFYPRKEREFLYGTSTRNEIDDLNINLYENKFIKEINNKEFINNGIVGLRVSESDKKIIDFKRIDYNQAEIILDGEDDGENHPFVLSNVEFGGGNGGFVSTTRQNGFEQIFETGSSNSKQNIVIPDGEGSAYHISIGSDKRIKIKRIHGGTKKVVDVNILGIPSQVTSAQEIEEILSLEPFNSPYVSGQNLLTASSVRNPSWINDKIKSISANILIKKARVPNPNSLSVTRRLIIFILTENDENYLLISGQLPTSFGNEARKQELVPIVFNQFLIPTNGEWVGFENFIPSQSQIVIVGQGDINANAYLLMTNQNLLKYVLINTNFAFMNSTKRGNFGALVSTEPPKVTAFKAVGGTRTIEVLAKTSEEKGFWYRLRARESGSGVLTFIPEIITSSKFMKMEDHGFDKTDICYIKRSATTDPTNDLVVCATITPLNSVNIVYQRLNSVGNVVVEENEYDLAIERGNTLSMIGGDRAHLFISQEPSVLATDLYLVDFKNGNCWASSAIRIPGVLESGNNLPVRVKKIEGNSYSIELATSNIFTNIGDDNIANDNVAKLISQKDTFVVMNSGDKISILKDEPPVRMRSRGVKNDLELSRIINDGGVLDPVEGAKIATFRTTTTSGFNEWYIISGGIKSGENDARGGFNLVRRLEISGSESWHFTNKLFGFENGRAFHSICAISDNTNSKGYIFTFGGKSIGNLDGNSTDNMIVPQIIRYELENLDTESSNPSEQSFYVSSVAANSIEKSIVLANGIPPMVNAPMFLCYDGSGWQIVIISAPFTYVISEDSPSKTFFGVSLPDETDIQVLENDVDFSFGDRMAHAIFQIQYGTSNLCWSADLNNGIAGGNPSVTYCLFYGGEGAVSNENNLFVAEYNPVTISTNYYQVVVSGNIIPENRTDCTLVYSGVKSTTGDPRHLFYMYGGKVGNEIKDDLWLLEFWYDSQIASYRAEWIFLTSGRHHGLLPSSVHSSGSRRPIASPNPHSVVFFGGKTNEGITHSSFSLNAIPAQMRNNNDLDLSFISQDMGGYYVPIGSSVISEPLDIGNVQSVNGPLVIENLENNTGGVLRVGFAFESNYANSLRIITYNSTLANWEEIPIGELHRLSSASIVNTGLLASPLVRGVSSYFPSSITKMYVILYFDQRDSVVPVTTRAVSFSTSLRTTTPNGITWIDAPDGLYAYRVTPQSICLVNDTGQTLDYVKVIVSSFKPY